MTVRNVLDYLASFRPRWNRQTERELLGRFRLDETKKASALSRGQKTQLALMGAICAEPELLVLDEPTSGLDPIVRREFIQTVIGAYQEADPGNRTVFVSTHLISEFEGLIDEFTIIENGRAELTLEADEARSRYKKIRARFAAAAPAVELPGGAACPARGPGAGADRQRPFGRGPATAPVPGAGGADDGSPDAGGDLRGGVEVDWRRYECEADEGNAGAAADLCRHAAADCGALPDLARQTPGLSAMSPWDWAAPCSAGCAFGNEFQHRTLSLLLSQPIARSVLWRDKMLVLGAGIVTSLAVLLGCLASVLSRAGADESPLVLVLIALCAFCGAPYWTLRVSPWHRRHGVRGGRPDPACWRCTRW